MVVECSICANNLLETPSCATACGHMYHKNCLASWRQKGSGCPQCRSPINQIIDLYFPEDSEVRTIDLIMKNVVQLNSGTEARDQYIKASIDLLLATVQSLNTSINELKKDNAVIKSKLNEIESKGLNGAESNEQLKTKNALIESLKKENQELKLQRADAAKQLNEIHQQMAIMKVNNRAPLKTVNGNDQQSKALTLSLKFDDINDQIIINDIN